MRRVSERNFAVSVGMFGRARLRPVVRSLQATIARSDRCLRRATNAAAHALGEARMATDHTAPSHHAMCRIARAVCHVADDARRFAHIVRRLTDGDVSVDRDAGQPAGDALHVAHVRCKPTGNVIQPAHEPCNVADAPCNTERVASRIAWHACRLCPSPAIWSATPANLRATPAALRTPPERLQGTRSNLRTRRNALRSMRAIVHGRRAGTLAWPEPSLPHWRIQQRRRQDRRATQQHRLTASASYVFPLFFPCDAQSASSGVTS